jgi:transcriptional regulator with XRE-family HTH domain
MKRVKADDLHKEWMHKPSYRREYEALEEEYALVAALLQARAHAGLTQAQVARRMKTTQTAVARLEGGRVKPSTRTLENYAAATGHRLVIRLEPAAGTGRRAQRALPSGRD